MRIAVVTHVVNTHTGQGRVNYELVRYLIGQGVSVHCIASHVADSLLDQGVTWTPIQPEIETVELVRVRRFQHHVDNVLDRIGDDFDVILGCGYTLTHPHTVNVVHFVHDAWLASASHPIRQGWSPRNAYQWLFTKANTRWELDALRQAERIVAVSEKIRDELITIGLPPDRIHTIVNGVDLDEFHPANSSTPSRSSLGLPAEVPLAFFAGDIRTNRKNLDSVLRALVHVPNLQLAIAGSLPGSPYPALAERLGVSDRTHFLGFRTDVAYLMQVSDFFVFPSRYEACTLVLIEALASGLPVISAYTTGGVEIVGSDAGYILEDPEDVTSLAQYMYKLAVDTDLRLSMSRAARRTAENYSWADMSARYTALFEDLVVTPV